jgi:hypothetical protein
VRRIPFQHISPWLQRGYTKRWQSAVLGNARRHPQYPQMVL